MTNKYVNILCVGDARVGKTAYINRLMTVDFIKDYVHTESQTVSSTVFGTTLGDITLNIIEAFGPYFPTDIDMVWIMFDVCDMESFNRVERYWYPLIKKLKKPVMVLGNKVDCNGRVVKMRYIKKMIEKVPLRYYDISAMSCYNYEKPVWEAFKHKYGDIQIIELIRGDEYPNDD